MTSTQIPEAPIRRYLTVLHRRVGILLAFVVLVPVTAVTYSLTQSDLYRAESTVLISRQSIANQLSGGADVGLQQQSFQQVLVTQARLARTPAVLRETILSAGDIGQAISIERLRGESAVAANSDSDLLTFSVTRPDIRGAKRLAISYANAYVKYRRSLDSSALNRALGDVKTALAEASRGSGPQNEQLIIRLTTSRQQLETRLALQTANAQVVAGPDEATKVRPKPLRSGVLGLLVGVIFGLLAAFLRDALDTRVRTSVESESLLGTPVLSRIPRPRPTQGGTGLVMLGDAGGAIAESVRILRTSMSFGLLSKDAKVVMVTSCAQGEGKSTTIANLAVACALSGDRVAIVDLDLRRPSLGRLFGLKTGAGVTGVALGKASLEEALESIDLGRASDSATASARLDVLTSGALPPDPAEFVNTESVSAIIDQLRRDYDLVLIDAPPLLSVSDTSVIAERADALFVCIRLGLVRRPMLMEFRRTLDRLPTALLGQVITGAERDGTGGYYRAYYTYGTVNEAGPHSSEPSSGAPASDAS